MPGKQAFKASRFTGFFFEPDKLVIVGLDVPISDDLAHLYDERCHDQADESTVKDMMAVGCLEPVLVTKIGEAKDPFVVDGRGRVIAAREANRRLFERGKELIRVPAVLKRGPEHVLFGMSISANELRRSDDAIRRADKVARYLDMGRTEEEAATRFGVNEATIKNWLKLSALAPSVKQLVKQGKLSVHAAVQLAKLPHAEQKAKAKEALQEAAQTGGRVTGRSMSKKTGSTKPASPPKRIVKRIIEEQPAIKPEHDNFWSALQFMLGELSPEDVGVDTVFAKVAKEKADKAKQAAEKKAKAAEKKANKAKQQPAPTKKQPTPAKKRGGKTAAA